MDMIWHNDKTYKFKIMQFAIKSQIFYQNSRNISR